MAIEMNEAKLPQWAQTRLEVARRNEAKARQELANAIGETPTAIEVEPYRIYQSGNPPRTFLSDHATVRFSLGERDHIDVCLRNGKVEIMASSRLVLTPSASNVIHASCDE